MKRFILQFYSPEVLQLQKFATTALLISIFVTLEYGSVSDFFACFKRFRADALICCCCIHNFLHIYRLNLQQITKRYILLHKLFLLVLFNMSFLSVHYFMSLRNDIYGETTSVHGGVWTWGYFLGGLVSPLYYFLYLLFRISSLLKEFLAFLHIPILESSIPP